MEGLLETVLRCTGQPVRVPIWGVALAALGFISSRLFQRRPAPRDDPAPRAVALGTPGLTSLAKPLDREDTIHCK